MLIGSLLSLKSVSAACLSLKVSSVCPAFAQYSVYQGTGQQDTVNFPTIDQFDNYVTSHLLSSNNAQVFNAEQSCNAGPKNIPYLASLICATFVDISQKKYNCTDGLVSGQPVKTLCKQSAMSASNEIKDLINNPEICTPKANRNTSIYKDVHIFALNYASSEPDCIVSQVGDISNPTSEPNVTTNNQADGTTRHVQFTPIIIAGIVGAVILVFVIAFLVYSTMRKRHSTKTENNHTLSSISSDFFKSGEKGKSGTLASTNTGVAYTSTLPTPPETENIQGGAQVTETVKVIHEYVENLFDEMTLNIGDRVLISTRFNDGWAFGLNLDTKQQGISFNI